MAVSENLVYETSTTTGTSDFTLAGAANGFQSFNSAFGTGGSDVFYYFISHTGAAEWEVGTGSLSASTTLVRDTIIDSSNSGSAVNFSAGSKNVTSNVPAGYRLNDVATQVFTSSGTYTPTSGMRYCVVEVLGGGGGGGGAGTNDTAGGGGGSGGYSQAVFTASDIGSSVTVTIGAGGGGGASGNNAGSSGGSTTFGALITCNGGAGGAAGNGSFGYAAGGTASGGDLNISGSVGDTRVTGSNMSGPPKGGVAIKYGGTHGAYWAYAGGGSTAGQDGTGYGSGGGGAIRYTTSNAGGDGADGLVVITEFF